MSELKIMSFNIRVESDCDGINHQRHRRGRILATIEAEKPDLLGFQEASDDARAFLRAHLTDYTLIGCGRCVGYRGESAPLAFRSDRFEMIRSECFWLSSHPSVPGSIYEGSDQSGCPRIATAAVLMPIDGDTPILFLNVHTDHMGKEARRLASLQILSYIEKAKLPVVLTGDFNATPESTEIRLLSDALSDLTQHLGGTFHDFGRKTPEAMPKIDYIFTTLPTDPAPAYTVADIPDGGLYTSDHNAVVAFATL